MNTWICCGFTIPEGRQVCPQCESFEGPDAILEDGTPLYLKTSVAPNYASLQLAIYDMLGREEDASNGAQ